MKILRNLQTTKDISLIYGFHLFNNIAITVAANFLFLDQLFLRMQLNLSHIGLIKGISYLIPMTVNLLLSPVIQRLNRDREIVAFAYLFRVSLPLLLLVFPQIGLEKNQLAAAVGLALVVIHIFPIVANNSVHVLISASIDVKSLGKHLGGLQLIWTLPGFLLAIPLSRYMDTFALQPDSEFYRGLFYCMAGTGVFQVVASGIILSLPRPDSGENASIEKFQWFYHIISPFRDKKFRLVLRVILLTTLFSSMVRDFINPYFLSVLQMNMGMISYFSAGVSVLSIVSFPLWGRAMDRIGGRNSYRIALAGLTLGIAALLGEGLLFIILFAILAWDGSRGVFGSGIQTIHQYLTMVNTPKGKRNTYFASATFAAGVGLFLGPSIGGIVLDALIGRLPIGEEAAAFRIYFIGAMAGLGSVMLFVHKLPHDRKHIPGRDMWLYIYRFSRSLFGRFR
jgi:hypothetical protein